MIAVEGKIAIQSALLGYAKDDSSPPVSPIRQRIRVLLAVETVRNNSSLHLINCILSCLADATLGTLRNLV